MAQTAIDCANLALLHLGEKRIAALTDENPRARAMSGAYEPTRRAELRANVWTFATRRALVPETLPAPPFRYSHKYALPEGCIRVVQVGVYDVPRSMAELQGAPYQYYKLEGGFILCDDAAPLPVRYVFDETDASLWDTSFYDFLALKLAEVTCMDIVKDSELRDSLRVKAMNAFFQAVRIGAVEEPPTELPDDTWLLSRHT